MSSNDLLKLIDLWLQWDQCETTRKEIEQLKVNRILFVNSIKKYLKIFIERMNRNGMI